MNTIRNWWWTLITSKSAAYFQGYNAGLKQGRTTAYRAMNARLDSVLGEITHAS